MENPENNMSTNDISSSKKPSLSTIIMFLVLVLAIIGFFVIKNMQKNEVNNTENTATTTEQQIATSTDNSVPATSSADSESKPAASSPVLNTGVKVIQGDGYTATLKPVYGEAPIINSFEMNKVSETCRFTWDVSKAKRCDLLNSETKEGIKDVGSTGTVQMNDAGNYILRCYGDGGKSVTSEVLSCK